MEISDEQVKLLQEMAGQLDKLGITLGLLTSHVAFIPKDAEFIIRMPTGEYDVPMLLHKDDINIRQEGNILIHEPVADPKHDEEAQTVINTLNEALMNGEISFDPVVKRNAEGLGDFEIVRRDLTNHPKVGCYLYELPYSTHKGNLWAYHKVKELADAGDERFILMKQIIDEEWPDEAENCRTEQVDRKPVVKATTKYMPSKLFRAFQKWLGMQ